ncbi:helix-turn-helix transcriptional regulator [Sulfurisoma sediminicola]|uniref:helix-turn-helix transcriptional regulator n=1 Tax=Sulfurisoma sediminicola TaxID=1381557 RepID=UPI000EADC0C0|nr:helix-turn-helix domain-containing protein [Sulfurisoma sediminicola]
MVDALVVYTALQLCELLGISKRHFYKLLGDGVLPPPVRLGRATRWPASSIDAWLAAQVTQPPSSSPARRSRAGRPSAAETLAARRAGLTVREFRATRGGVQ